MKGRGRGGGTKQTLVLCFYSKTLKTIFFPARPV